MAMRQTKKESPEKRLWRLLAGLAAVRQSISYLQSFPKIEGDETLEAAIWSAFMVTYSKPFKKNHDVQSLPLKHVPNENRELHHKILLFRDLYYGHIDPRVKMDSGEKLHRIRFRVTEDEIIPNPTFSRPAPDTLPQFFGHTMAVATSLDHAIQALLDENECLRVHSEGDYELDYTAAEMIRRL
jgi:hypothetical protein